MNPANGSPFSLFCGHTISLTGQPLTYLLVFILGTSVARFRLLENDVKRKDKMEKKQDSNVREKERERKRAVINAICSVGSFTNVRLTN